MAEILSQAEIDALLAALTAGEVSPEELKKEERKVRLYDFRRPNKFSKEQINAFQIIYENYARSLATFLSAQLRCAVQVAVASLDQLTYEEFVRSLPEPTLLVIFNMSPLEGNGVVEINLTLALTMIDRLFGGPGKGLVRGRPLTEIERTIMERTAQRMLDLMREAWESVAKLNPKVDFLESNPQFAQIVSPMEMVILISLSVKIGEVEGLINFCIPYIVLEPIIDRLSLHYWFARAPKENRPENRLFIEKRIAAAKLPVRVVLGSTRVTVRELLDLQVGDVVSLDQKVSEDLAVLVGGRPKFRARPGTVNNRLGVQITSIVKEGGDSP